MNEFSKETLEQAKSFDLIKDDYGKAFGGNPYQEAAMAWLTDRLQPNEKVLDVGSGDGLGSAKHLIESGMKVTGIDSSLEMLKMAKENVPEGEFIHMDMRQMEKDGKVYDAVAAFFSLIFLSKEEFPKIVAELVKKLRVGGFLVFSLVEGHFDDKEVIFLGQKIRLSSYLVDEVREQMAKLPLNELKVKKHNFKPKGKGYRESQIFFYYQKVKEA